MAQSADTTLGKRPTVKRLTKHFTFVEIPKPTAMILNEARQKVQRGLGKLRQTDVVDRSSMSLVTM